MFIAMQKLTYLVVSHQEEENKDHCYCQTVYLCWRKLVHVLVALTEEIHPSPVDRTGRAELVIRDNCESPNLLKVGGIYCQLVKGVASKQLESRSYIGILYPRCQADFLPFP